MITFRPISLFVVVLGFVLLFAGGCGTKEVPLDEKILGSWQADVEMPKSDETGGEFGAAMAKAFMGNVTLDIRKDKSFTLTMLFPIEGTWKLEGTSLTLTPTSVMGMPATKENDNNQPMVFNVVKDGTRLEPADTKKEDMSFAFVKKGATSSKGNPAPGTGEVKKAQTNKEFYGEWVGELQSDASTKTENDATLEMVKGMLGEIKLSIHENGTFDMTMMFPFKGNWTKNGNTLKLVATEAMGMKVEELMKMSKEQNKASQMDISDEPIILEISDDLKELRAKENTNDKSGTLVFKRP